MTVYSAIIADDEPPIREHFAALLGKLWPELQVAGIAGDGREALDMIQRQRPDVVFLDIKMPLLSGLQVAMQMRHSCQIIFVTAYDNYAIEAFERAALDYLLKPVTEERLLIALARLRQRLTERSSQAVDVRMLADIAGVLQAPRQYLRWVRAAKGDGMTLVPIVDICYFQAEDKYTTVVTRDQEYLIKTSLKELETQLDPEDFWRIHRNTIVNIQYVSHCRKELNGGYQVHLKSCNNILTASRGYGYLFKQM